MMRDDLNARLLRTFVGELDEQVEVMNAALLALEQAPADEEARRSLFRAAHTIKGAARILALSSVENVCHSLEEFFAAVRDGHVSLEPAHFELLFRSVDALADAQRRLGAGETLDDSPVARLDPELRALARAVAPPPGRTAGVRAPPSGVTHHPLGGTHHPRDAPSQPAPAPPQTAPDPAPTADSPTPAADPTEGSEPGVARDPAPESGAPEDDTDAGDRGAADAAEPTPAAAAAPTPAAAAEPTPSGEPGGADMVRVDASRLESLHGSAGDLLVAATRLESRLADLGALRAGLEGWASERRRQRAQQGRAARQHGVSGAPGPAPANPPDAPADLDVRIEQLRTAALQLERALRDDGRAVRRASDAVGADVRGLRLRPIADAFQALPRAVRDVAAAGGKQVRLEIEAGDVQADRLVVDALREPLLHIVRNAIDHGIESPDERARAGKDPIGTVRITATLAQGRVVVTIGDDGRGLDTRTLRRRFRERGLEPPGSDRELARTLLTSGISSRGIATEISGRGVGLDLVRAGLERIRGNVNVRWTEGAGTTFILESPPSPTMLRALLVHCGAQILALPSMHVKRLLRVRRRDVRQSEGRSVILGEDGPIPLAALATLLGAPLAPPRAGDTLQVAVLEVAERRIAVAVDAFEAEQDIVVRPLEGAAASVRHVGGGALLPSGRVALVVHMPRIVAAGASTSADALGAVGPPESAERQRVLVADDSITTRTLEQSLLEAAGYDVTTAVDGMDAWRLLQERGADLVVADVEMPRMDGFSLCETIRRTDRFAALPVILVTGLEAPEHRARGLAAGADAYLPKSAFDQEQLLQTIRELLD